MRISDWSSDVCSSDLDTALAAYGAASGVQLVYDSRLTAGLATNGVSGTYTAQDALSLLLAGTGLTPRFSGPQMATIEPAPQGAKLPPVVVAATRAERPVSTIPGAVVVIDRAEVEKHLAGSSDPTEAIGRGSGREKGWREG